MVVSTEQLRALLTLAEDEGLSKLGIEAVPGRTGTDEPDPYLIARSSKGGSWRISDDAVIRRNA